VSKLKEQLQRIKVYNSWEFAGKGNVFISYTPTEPRSVRCAGWKVYRPGYRTDPQAARYDGGCKTFTVSGKEDKPLKLEVAKKWAGERYGIKEWVKSPYGDWMDAEYVKRRLAELKEQLKLLPVEVTS
jgi:hypothetical protein